MSTRARLAVIVGTRGRGSNMLALVRAGREGRMPADVAVVVGAQQNGPAMDSARAECVETLCLDERDPEFGSELARELLLRGIDLVCLAGYLRLLPSEVLRAFPDRVLNIHPALLPDFGGKGMYGHHVHDAVLAAGSIESGATVHLVNEVYDEGRIILQRRCPVLPDDTSESLAARVLQIEHALYPEAVAKVWSELETA